MGVSQVAQVVKNPLAMQETRETPVWSLGWEDPLEKERTTHSGILAWKIPWWAMVHGAAKCQTWLSNTHIIHYEIQLYMSFLKYPVSLCALSIHIPPFTFPFIHRSWIYACWFRGERQQSGKIKVTKFVFLSWIFFSKSMSQVLSGSAKKSSSLVWRWGWGEGKHKSLLSRALQKGPIPSFPVTPARQQLDSREEVALPWLVLPINLTG